MNNASANAWYGRPMCVKHRVPLEFCERCGPAAVSNREPAEQPLPGPRWSPARLAYAFYATAAAGAVVGQVWVAMTRIEWPAAWPMWARIAAVAPFALCLELLAMALAAMADERQRLGERAYGFRVFSAVVAVVAVGVLVAGHWGHAYQVAAFGALSTSAYVLWLLHSGARRRDALRAAGKLAEVAPAYGWYRRLRHPVLVARAAELARERGLGLYESLRAGDLELRAEARRPAIAAAVESVVRSDHADTSQAEIAVRTLDMDRIAAELEARADYAGWADRLAPAVQATRPQRPASTPPRAIASDPEPTQPRKSRGRGKGKRRRRSAAETAALVAAARQEHPGATQKEIGKQTRIGVRSVTRYWHGSGSNTSEPAEVTP